MPLTLDDFDYELPARLIAQRPPAERGGSRLLRIDGGAPRDMMFRELPTLLGAGDLLVFNDSRVIHARLHGVKESGGRVEVLVERALGPHQALAQIRASQVPSTGDQGND